jgi:hypothetical protein
VIVGGVGKATGDTLGVAMLSLGDGKMTMLGSRFGENGRIIAVDGHDALMAIAETQFAWSLYTLDADGGMKLAAKVGRPLWGVSVSRDMQRVALSELDYRADAWMHRVVVR